MAMALTENPDNYIPFFFQPLPHNDPTPPKVTPPPSSPFQPKVATAHGSSVPPKVTPPHLSLSPPAVPPPSHPSTPPHNFPSPPKAVPPFHPIISSPPPSFPVPATPPAHSFHPTPPGAKPPTHSRPPPAPTVMPPPPPPGHHSTVIVVVFVSLGGLFFLAFLSVGLCCFITKKKTKERKSETVSINEHVKVQEAIVPGPHGEEVKVLTIEEDVHIQEEIDKKSFIEGFHNHHFAEGHPQALNSEPLTSESNHHHMVHKA